MNEGAPFDWPLLMRVGIGALGLAPEVFWAMTPRELDAAIKGRFGNSITPEAMNSGELAALSNKFPDEEARQ